MKGIGFTHFADEGLEVVCAGGLLLENNTFAWNGTAGAGLVAPTAIIRGNTFAYNGKQGMGGNNLKETLVEHNISYQNNVENYSLKWSAAGIKVINSKKTSIRHNVVENNNGAGIWIDISVIDNELSYNTIKRNNGFGIFSELSNGTLIAGNLLIDNRNFGVAIADGDSSEVWNNTIVSANGKGFYVKDSPRLASSVQPGSPFYNNSRECTWITRGNIIKNNIVVTSTGLWMENTAPAALQVKESDFNGYYRTSTNDDANIYKWNAVNYKSLDAFKAAVPNYETHSVAAYRPAANPFFADTTYVLKAGSPAIKAGAPLPAKVAELLGLPAGKAVDMGAVQTVAPAAPGNLTANVLSQRTIELTWQDQADNEEGYRVERATDSLFVTVASLAANATSYRDTALSAGTAYRYRVVAHNSGGESPSDEVGASTLAAGTGLLASYYKSKHFNGSSFTRTDPQVDFQWGEDSPDASLSHNTFSVRWEGELEAVYSQTYTFKTVTDDGVRLWVDGVLLIDDWTERG